MAVRDTTTLDQVAEGPDGRVVLVEDSRQKLSACVYLIRSGQLRGMVGDAASNGVDIRLFSVDEPPAVVPEMILCSDVAT